jgi:hypothetical protein
MMCPPHFLQNRRSEFGTLVYSPTKSCPLVIRTLSGFQRLNALTGPADHARQDAQWQ